MAPLAAARLLTAALLAAAASATVIQVRDSWNYVSGTAVTNGGQLQPDVWRVCVRTARPGDSESPPARQPLAPRVRALP